jgi:hypothetical protein
MSDIRNMLIGLALLISLILLVGSTVTAATEGLRGFGLINAAIMLLAFVSHIYNCVRKAQP